MISVLSFSTPPPRGRGEGGAVLAALSDQIKTTFRSNMTAERFSFLAILRIHEHA